MYDFLKDQKLNASLFFENALIRMKSGLKNDTPTYKNMGMILVCPVDKNENTSSAVHVPRREEPVSDILAGNGITIDTVKDGDNLSWNGGYSMAVFLKSWESRYVRYKKNAGVQQNTINANLKEIYKLTWVYDLEDIKDRDDIKKSEKDAVYEVCAFLRDELTDSHDTFNTISNSQFRKVVAARYNTKRGKHSHQKTRELINYPEIVTETMELLDYDVQVFYILTAICGARTTQLFRIFEKPLKILKHAGFFRVVAEEVGQGSKLATEYFFPNDYLSMVENFQLYYADRMNPASFYNESVSVKSRVINPAIPCNLSSLRKFCKAVFTKSHIPKASAEYTQGRKPQDVGDKDYDNLAIAAVDDYPQVLPYWEKYVHLPEWMKDGEEVRKRVEAAIRNRSPSGQHPKEWNEAAIIRRLKEGATNAELKKEFGIGAQKITDIVKREGIVRKNDRGTSKKRGKHKVSKDLLKLAKN